MSQVDNFDKDIVDAQTGANLDNTNQTETTEQTNQEAAPETDYEVKFKASQKEALRLYEEDKKNKRLIEELQAQKEQEVSHAQTTEDLYPGFDQLDPDAQANIIAFSEGITKKVRDEFSQDPAIAFSRKNYNENVWDNALNGVLSKYPELSNTKEEFKNKYFNANNVPSNIEEILDDVAKIYLFDKAREIGAEDEKARQSRIETERTTGGNRDVQPGRTTDDWRRMMETNPAKFASMSKEYYADLESGKLT